MIASTYLTLDRSGSRLFYIVGPWLIAFSIPERRYSYFAKDSLVRQIAIDDKFIYWPQQEQFIENNKPVHGRIMRLPLDHTPVLTVDPASITP